MKGSYIQVIGTKLPRRERGGNIDFGGKGLGNLLFSDKIKQEDVENIGESCRTAVIPPMDEQAAEFIPAI